jgi:hypothetical protein
MGRNPAIDTTDYVKLLMSEDRAFPNKEIADSFEVTIPTVRHTTKRAKSEGYPVYPTRQGIRYIGQINKLEHLVALVQMQAWATQTAAATRKLAMESEKAIKETPKRLLLTFQKEFDMGNKD